MSVEKKCKLVLDKGTAAEKTVFASFPNEQIAVLKTGRVNDSRDFQVDLYTTPDCEWNRKDSNESNKLTLWFGELLMMLSSIEEQPT